MPIFNDLIDTEECLIWKQENEFEKIKYDFEALGLSLGEHPASIVIQTHWPYRQSHPKELIQSDQLLTKNSNQTIKVFGLLSTTSSTICERYGFYYSRRRERTP